MWFVRFNFLTNGLVLPKVHVLLPAAAAAAAEHNPKPYFTGKQGGLDFRREMRPKTV
jgi:hypothetical protein